jgi:hypothetical protein
MLGSIPGEVIEIFNWPNPSSCTMVLGSTQPLIEMSSRNLPGSNRQLEPKADNLTTIYELIFYKVLRKPMKFNFNFVWNKELCITDVNQTCSSLTVVNTNSKSKKFSLI